MITEPLKAFAKRHWPALRLRTYMFGVLFFVASLPGLSAIFLRVYENTLVRQTQAELTAQGAALVAAAEAGWPGAPAARRSDPSAPGYYRAESLNIDLNSNTILPERPPASQASPPIDPAAEAAAAKLKPIIDQTSQTTLASIVLVDRNGTVVIGDERGGGYAVVPEVRKALTGGAQTVLRRNGSYEQRYAFEWLSRAAAIRVHHARPVIVDGQVVGVLVLSRSARALFRGLYQDRGKIILAIAGIFGLLVLLAGVVSRGVAKPIEGLSAAAREVAEGHGEIPPTPATAAIEIRDLYEDFRAMAEVIAKRSRYLRDFAASLSHEFKTPLAGIAGGVELLEDHYADMSEAERRRFLGNISADTARLTQLVTRLMDLARADMAQPESGVAVDLGGPLRRTADALRGDNFAVEVQAPGGEPLVVAVPEGAVETVLTTLIDNSRKAGAARVTVRARREEGGICVRVADDGAGIPKADRERLFEPFFTSRRAAGGTGLGLAIARSLLSASNGRIAFVETPKGASFDVWLPLASVTNV